MSKHKIWELKQMQAMPLELKVRMTQRRIKEWYENYDGEVYISFSGGKDSTVLIDIARKIYPDITAVFCDTGLEYPEIRDFVKTFDNVEWLKPKMQFKQVIEKYGYPFFGKETAEAVYCSKRYLTKLAEQEESTTDLLSLAKSKDKWEMPYRVSIMLGQFETHWQKKKMGIIPKDGEPSRAKYSQEKYQFMLNAPFNISHMCCQIMKKNPTIQYSHKTNRHPITAQMAEESRLRKQKWLENGCNGFDLKEPISNPMSFWTEQDILQYIVLHGNEMVENRVNSYKEIHEEINIEEICEKNKEWCRPICSVYGEVVAFDEDGMFYDSDTLLSMQTDLGSWKLKTTGCNRTGCMFCGFGCHLEKPGEGRFEKMKETHPKQYEWIMKPWNNGGLGYKDVIDWINENGNMNIRY